MKRARNGQPSPSPATSQPWLQLEAFSATDYCSGLCPDPTTCDVFQKPARLLDKGRRLEWLGVQASWDWGDVTRLLFLLSRSPGPRLAPEPRRSPRLRFRGECGRMRLRLGSWERSLGGSGVAETSAKRV